MTCLLASCVLATQACGMSPVSDMVTSRLYSQQSHTVTLGSSGWPQTQDPPVSASHMLGLQDCPTMASDLSFLVFMDRKTSVTS